MPGKRCCMFMQDPSASEDEATVLGLLTDAHLTTDGFDFPVYQNLFNITFAAVSQEQRKLSHDDQIK